MSRVKIAFIVSPKQGDLWDALKRNGWTQAEAASFLGMKPTAFGLMLNLKRLPISTPELEVQLIKLTGKTLEELFPEELRTQELLESGKVLAAISRVGPVALASAGILASPVPSFQERLETRDELASILAQLPPRQRDVIGFRLGLGESGEMTLAEIGIMLCLSRERIRQIELRAMVNLRKIGHDLTKVGS